VREMRRIKPILGVSALVVWIFGEQWLRTKMREVAWHLP